ncbi:SDR family NAD(P)-dependent oxidoreductase [Kitasatospora sp. NBC_01287]|uniref:SDR family NAD(P)-dependent oxidoreductase n=1 Tax=Kitasatospora sp. NBC_01287 TaxID=2903573 RepID=UPI00225B1B00|nr:SDR family NAD(P)-dependent oxidoreductase [Kitasatospora sp. NBC_01287]MCX4750548.1 SDR family NAD(P)-dependent oxidoreductase [Kitasatospora sp. NBC_01287]
MPGLVIVGAGPGLGAAVAARFGREGLPVAAIARSQAVDEVAATVGTRTSVPVLALRADSSDRAALHAALDIAVDAHGVPDVLVYNAAIIRSDRPGELNTQQHLDAWSVNVLGAMDAVTHLAPQMARVGGGTVIITGGMPQPISRSTSLSLGKAGVRALTHILDQEYGDSGVHVATVTVACAIVPGTDTDPDLIAEHYWALHRQPRAQWQHEIVHSTSAPA